MNPYMNHNPRIRTKIFRVGVDIACAPRSERGPVTPKEESIADQWI